MISEQKKTFAQQGEKQVKKVEINGSICIDFLVGIHIYLERNMHEERGKIERSREKEREREMKILALIFVGGEKCLVRNDVSANNEQQQE